MFLILFTGIYFPGVTNFYRKTAGTFFIGNEQSGTQSGKHSPYFYMIPFDFFTFQFNLTRFQTTNHTKLGLKFNKINLNTKKFLMFSKHVGSLFLDIRIMQQFTRLNID
jgi:hypothetical protein